MSNGLEVKCNDFLKDNRRLYAHKARRKKIALTRVEVVNQFSTEVRLMFGDSKLISGVRSHDVEPPSMIIRKLSEFTWDMAVFLILDFHPLLSAVDFLILVTGPLYNRRLKKQLHWLTDADLILKPGKAATALLGFRKVSSEVRQLQIVYCDAGGDEKELKCDIS